MGSQAAALAVFLARHGAPKEFIKEVMETWFLYDMDHDLDELHEEYVFDVSSQGTVPIAITCALKANSFEEVMPNGLYVGGDTDTLLAIAGAIAEPLYGVPSDYRDKAETEIAKHSKMLLGTLQDFERRYGCGKNLCQSEFSWADILNVFKKPYRRFVR